MMRRLAVVPCLLLFVAVARAEQDAAARFKKVADRLVKAINTADHAAIQRDFGKIMLDAFPLKKVKAFFQNLDRALGKIRKLDPPRLVPPSQAIFPAHFERGILNIKIVLDSQNRITGLWFLPRAPDIPVPEKHQTKLSLPFRGRWLVFWGGDTRDLNRHHDVPNQRYAFDFVIVDERGKTHKGEGRSNKEYYAFGKEVLAPADGTVTEVIEGVRDNVPRSMNPYSALGNAVFIQHRKHEVSVLAHFKRGSIRVKVGDKVKRGQVIGLCGNSGNSSEPHLHYHLQNTPIIQDGTGIKCYFEKVVTIKGNTKKARGRYSPVKGEIISPE